MLMSVTGAWADEVVFYYSAKYKTDDTYSGESEETAVAEKQDMSNIFFRVVVNDASFYETNVVSFMLSDVHEGYIKASSFTVNNKDAAHVNIQQILVTKYDGQSEFSYPNGQSEATFQFNGLTVIKKIKIIYTLSHEHTMSEWKHDDDAHWQECVGDGICTANNTRFNQANHTYSDDVSQGASYYTCATCGYVNEQRKHQHVANDEWSTDANQHWHACLGTVGQCDANGKLDIANHTYGSMYGEDASVYYACTVCGYVDNTRKAQYDALDFLSMKALDAPMTIGMTKTGSPADYDLQYSLDRTHWTTVALTATNSNIVEIPAGQTCYFRHGTETAITRISSRQDIYWCFTMNGDGAVEAGGNVMSLLDATCQKNTLSGSPQHVFDSLFKGCARLTIAPKLPAATISQYCYMFMFEGTGITTAPELPATIIPDGAYWGMFKDCRNLINTPHIAATSLSPRACREMFQGCEQLTSVSLANITTMDQRTDEYSSFYNWLEGTAIDTEGVLIAPDALVGNPLIFLPQNWMFKQIKDYTTAVSNAMEGTTNFIQDIGEDYIAQIKQATSNAAALSLRNEALSDINTLKKYNSKLDASSFTQPTGVGMRLKVTKKDGNVYEFKTQDVESVDYYRVNE